MRSRHHVLASAAVVLLIFLGGSLGAADGGKYRPLVLEAHLAAPGGGPLDLVSQFDPIAFEVTSVQNKYKLIRMQVRNGSSKPLALAGAKDSLEAVIGGHPVAAILDLASRDAAVWDSFSPEVRKALAYPASIEAHEEEAIFGFVPSVQAAAAPSELRYTLDSVPQKPVVLRRASAAAAKAK